MNRSLKIFVACVLGGGAGAFVSLQLTPNFWWLGLITGGFVGYISYDFKWVIVAASEAWEMTVGFKLSRKNIFDTSAILSMLFFVGFSIWFLTSENRFIASFDENVRKTISSGLGFLLIFVWLSALGKASSAQNEAQKKGAKFAESEEIYTRTLALYFNPIAAFSITPVWGLWQCLKFGVKLLSLFWRLCRYCWRIVPRVLTAIGNFIKTLFILIHSEIRLLCMLDAAIGAGVGYYFGSALIGALAGGAFGVFNFQVISKWWLELVPVDK